MVGQGGDMIDAECLRQVFHGLAAQAIDDARLTLHGADIADELAVNILIFLSHFVVEVRPVERGLEDLCFEYVKVLLYVVLHLRCGGSGECDDRCFADTLNDGVNTAIFGPEVVPPFGDTVSLVNGIERYLDLFEEIDILGFVERLGSDIKQFGLAGEYIFLDSVDLGS